MSPASQCLRRLAWSCGGVALLSACTGGSMSSTPVAPFVDRPQMIGRGASAQSHETVLVSFGGANGAGPVSNMLVDSAGTFYGTTLFGGVGAGTVFKLTPVASGYKEGLAYPFKGGLDGKSPWGIVADGTGALYGITFLGGSSGNGGNGWGTVFKLSPGKSGYAESVLYRFAGGTDAWEPIGPPVLDEDGAIYGVGSFGGSRNDGAIFKLAPTKSGYGESVIYSFPGGAGGQLPQAGLAIDKQGSIYGTTMFGGSNQGYCGSDGGCGTVFKLTRQGSGYSESIIHAFTGSDGNLPYGVVTINERTGAIFGTTFWGGVKGVGVVYKLSPHGSTYTESVLYSFKGKNDGFLPEGGLLLKANGTLFGTAASGGGGCHGIGCGSVFELTPSHPGYSFRVVYDFLKPVNGADPQQTNLLSDTSGALYGATRSGGSDTNCSDGGPGGARGCGTVFKILP
jgi:uncharacterized repeat protein (TIGR03803 family)